MYIPNAFMLCNLCVYFFCNGNITVTPSSPRKQLVCPSVKNNIHQHPATRAQAANQKTDESFDIVRVLDGDTIEILAPFLPNALGSTLKVRILGVDTPERGWRAQCETERELAEEATKFVTSMVYGETWKPKTFIELDGWDKYGGRVLGQMYVRQMPLSPWMPISQLLIDKGLGKPYNGRGAKASWC